MSDTWRRSPLPADWEQRRRFILERDSWQCQERNRTVCEYVATEVDHLGAHDDHSLGNLQAICRGCHMHKTAVDAQRAGSPKRTPEPHPGFLIAARSDGGKR